MRYARAYAGFKVCRICQAETHDEDPWPNHMADCPDRVPSEQMLAIVTAARRVDHVYAEMRAQAEQRRIMLDALRRVAEARKRVAAGPPPPAAAAPAPPSSKHTPHYVRARQLELFQRAVDFLNANDSENRDGPS